MLNAFRAAAHAASFPLDWTMPALPPGIACQFGQQCGRPRGHAKLIVAYGIRGVYATECPGRPVAGREAYPGPRQSGDSL